MHNFTPWSATIGGALIGLSATLLLVLCGRVAGISGILEGVFSLKDKDVRGRLLFIFGLLLGGALLGYGYPTAFQGEIEIGWIELIVAGLFVGFGTRLGSGCTSGHGVCGLSRFSVRSLVATMTFMAVGFCTATVLHGWMVGQ